MQIPLFLSILSHLSHSLRHISVWKSLSNHSLCFSLCEEESSDESQRRDNMLRYQEITWGLWIFFKVCVWVGGEKTLYHTWWCADLAEVRNPFFFVIPHIKRTLWFLMVRLRLRSSAPKLWLRLNVRNFTVLMVQRLRPLTRPAAPWSKRATLCFHRAESGDSSGRVSMRWHCAWRGPSGLMVLAWNATQHFWSVSWSSGPRLVFQCLLLFLPAEQLAMIAGTCFVMRHLTRCVKIKDPFLENANSINQFLQSNVLPARPLVW